jgi:proteasome lid subunit RPN8/RPN11
VLRIDRPTYDEIVAHAWADHPDEACGLVAAAGGRPARVIRMANAARSPTFNEMDDRDEELLVIYHSHTATEAYPSRTDVSIAGYPEAHYVLVSTRSPDETEFRSYRIVDGVVTEEEVTVE